MNQENTRLEEKSFNVTGTTQCAIILPGLVDQIWKVADFVLTSDKAGSKLAIMQEDVRASVSAASNGTAIAVDLNGDEFQVGDLLVKVPFNWCSWNSTLREQTNVGLPFPFVGDLQLATVAAGSTPQSINVTAAMQVYPHDMIYHLTQVAQIPVGATTKDTGTGRKADRWVAPNDLTTVFILDGTAAWSIPFFIVERHLTPGYLESGSE